ncbi:class II aaRS and biotin synthetase [Yamadazyma tenuis ATCC 10573]|uniref:Class II aaRS and biotin synthetase n=2 Tax=Candida tenuis TaxID=2315449 RepID=G3B7Y7_CANTC|nr:class II aaRS and biotin synthetase [Yamadazyma tenuis ATCC 10573]EGV61690.1 class II aaRS and biotin synthetase [Yamadazyma tenuis ATCC 10573]
MGLLRSREFLMKDAYSFDVNEHEAMKSYHKMVGVYHDIFSDLRIPYVKAVADSGDIGGSLSHEWHYLHASGEDTVFTCSHSECGNVSNIEKTLSVPETIVECETESRFLQVGEVEYIKVVYPKDRHFDINLLKHKYPKIQEIRHTPESYTVVEDSRVSPHGLPMVLSEEGEVCFECKSGKLFKKRAIEVGHTFYLGTKYSNPLGLTAKVPEGDKLVERDVVMGCYGIGLSRIIASIAEITRDSQGFVWPRIISPWNVTVVESNTLSEDPSEIYDSLNKAQVDYRQDNRTNVNMGRKISHSNMIGIPLSIILGKKFPLIEIEIRGKRYGEDLAWKQLYHTKSFEWHVSTHGGVEKHLVDKDGLIAVLQALLIDM